MTTQKAFGSTRNFFVVNTNSWHYDLLDSIAEYDIPTNPLVYWTFLFPIALALAVAIKSFFALAWFCGYKQKKGRWEMGIFLPYKTDSRGKHILFAPWEITILSVAVYLVSLRINPEASPVLIFGLAFIGLLDRTAEES